MYSFQHMFLEEVLESFQPFYQQMGTIDTTEVFNFYKTLLPCYQGEN